MDGRNGRVSEVRADSPNFNGVIVTLCQPTYPLYHAIGGTFVFNGECSTADDPYGTKLAVESTSWGGIKSLFE